MFVRVDTNWHLFENTGNNGSPKLTPIDGNVISAKLKPNLRNNTEAIRVAQDLNLNFLRLNIAGWADFYLPNSANYFDLANGLKNHASISDVDINYFMTLADVNDPLAACTTGATSFSCQWAIANRGLQDTWDQFNYGNKGNTPGPIVAIFDTGLDITHPDIGPGTGANSHSNLWQNFPEVNGTTGADDDNNGIIDDKHGAYFRGSGQVPGQIANADIRDNFTPTPSHGTHVAGIVAAKTNNGVGMAGVAGGNNQQGARIMTIKVFGPDGVNPASSAALDDAIYYAVLNKAKILNFSLKAPSTLQLINALNFAADAGCFLVAASGNVQNSQDEEDARNGVGWFPASHPRVFGVGNGGGSVLPGGQTFSVSITSFYGNHTDIYAPGENIVSTKVGNNYGPISGTSMASPFVAGVAALMLAENPCLTGDEISNMLKLSAEFVPTNCETQEPPSSEQQWRQYRRCKDLSIKGVVDPYGAVQLAKNSSIPGIDVYSKDALNDLGAEPYTGGFVNWESPDIWVRNQPDGYSNFTHQSPVFSRITGATNTKYVYVRLRNRSCVDFQTASGNVSLYWAKASTGLAWPIPWDGSVNLPLTNLPLGGLIASQPVTNVLGGRDLILQFAWQIPDPLEYNDVTLEDDWHYCLLARWSATEDPIASFQPNVLRDMLEKSNNVVLKNITIVELNERPGKKVNKGTVAIANYESKVNNFDLVFSEMESRQYSDLFAEALVSVKLDPILLAKWEQNSILGTGIRYDKPTNSILLLSPNARIQNIELQPNETSHLTIEVNFLTQRATQDSLFGIRLCQLDLENQKCVSGETFEIRKTTIRRFKAYAGPDKYVLFNQNFTIQAQNMGEGYQYVFKNPALDTAYTGQQISMSTQQSIQLELQVTNLNDGYMDSDTCAIYVIQGQIFPPFPNPAIDQITVNYELCNVNEARLLVVGQNGSIMQEENLNVEENLKTFSITGLENGNYTLILVCNGLPAGFTHFMKNE